MIPSNKPLHLGPEDECLLEAAGTKITGNGCYTQKCQSLIEESFGTEKALLTTSGTSALEMAALLCDIAPGDEVIMPSFTFSSTATAFVREGARDIRPDTLNIDENLIEQAITPKTKAIVPVHYAGVGCEMDCILDIAQRQGLFVVEDAAQAVMSRYKSAALGSLGQFGCFSFHETKNYSMGEGGALLINDEGYSLAAEIIWEKGTNRSQFLAGQVDKYTWVSVRSSFLPSELNAAYLYPGLSQRELVNEKRLLLWCRYYERLAPLRDTGRIQLPFVPEHCTHNAHLFYVKTKDIDERNALIRYLAEHEVMATFHYVPLHTSPAGIRYGRMAGKDVFTTKESESLLRLPLFYSLTQDECDYVSQQIYDFYGVKA